MRHDTVLIQDLRDCTFSRKGRGLTVLDATSTRNAVPQEIEAVTDMFSYAAKRGWLKGEAG